MTHFGFSERPAAECCHFRSERVAHLYDWWLVTGSGSAPSWHSFDPAEHRRHLPYIYLVQPHPQGFEYRLHGERVVALFGRRAAGQVISSDSPSNYERHLVSYYRRVLHDGAPWACQGGLGFLKNDFREFESIDLPLCRRSDRPDTILGLIDLV